MAGWAADTMTNLGGPGVGVIVELENLFSPIPSEVVLPLAGFLAGQGSLNVYAVIGWATAGSVVGADAVRPRRRLWPGPATSGRRPAPAGVRRRRRPGRGVVCPPRRARGVPRPVLVGGPQPDQHPGRSGTNASAPVLTPPWAAAFGTPSSSPRLRPGQPVATSWPVQQLPQQRDPGDLRACRRRPACAAHPRPAPPWTSRLHHRTKTWRA